MREYIVSEDSYAYEMRRYGETGEHAGRSVASIGMELHCTDQTVRNHIDKAKAEGAIQ